MQNINHAIIAGNLTRDPELRTTQGGTPVLGFGVAVNDSRKNQQTGEWEDFPNYIDCVMFGNQAQALSGILRKGMKVTVSGKLRWSQWQDRQSGQNRSKVEVAVERVELPPRRGMDPQAGSQERQGSPGGSVQAAYNATVYDTDIPF